MFVDNIINTSFKTFVSSFFSQWIQKTLVSTSIGKPIAHITLSYKQLKWYQNVHTL